MDPQAIPFPRNFDGQTRLFPLGDLVLFPNAVLPLHIFESRYCEMMEDALRSDHLISMATLLPGFEHDYYCRPPIAPTVCIGRIADFQKTGNDSYDLLLIGLQRARVEHEIEPVRSFRRARVKLLDDFVAPSSKEAAEIAESLTDRLLQSMPSAQQLVDEFRQNRISLATLTDAAAFHLPLPTEVKLQLLGEADVLVRSRTLLANLRPSQPDWDNRARTYLEDFGLN